MTDEMFLERNPGDVDHWIDLGDGSRISSGSDNEFRVTTTTTLDPAKLRLGRGVTSSDIYLTQETIREMQDAIERNLFGQPASQAPPQAAPAVVPARLVKAPSPRGIRLRE